MPRAKPSPMQRLLWLPMILLAGCAVNPVTGKNELMLLDESQEINMGAKQYEPSQQSQGGRYVSDPGLTDYVSEIGQRLARVADRSLPYEFVVIDDSTPNAWALPGGKIAVNRGLLTKLNSEAELAAV
ncbi:MAG: putative Zn-dependent protease, partial [Candidatus Azotimanducaceae bacterium]